MASKYCLFLLLALLICGCQAQYKVILFRDTNTAEADGGFVQGAFDGIKDEGISEAQIFKHTIPIPDLLGAGFNVESLWPAAAGNVAFAVCPGFQYAQAVVTWAATHPNTTFILIDTVPTFPAGVTGLPNLVACLFAEDEGGYVAGVAAGSVTTTKKVGAIGGIGIPPVYRWLSGYVQGVASVCPDCEVIYDLINSFDNVGLANDLVDYLNSLGVDVVLNVAGDAGGQGLVHAAANHSMWVIGTDADAWEVLFDGGDEAGASKVIMSVGKGVSTATRTNINLVTNNQFIPGINTFRFQNGGIRVFPCHESCSLYDPSTNPATTASIDGMTTGSLSTGVDANTGAILYTTSVAINSWGDATPLYKPTITSSTYLTSYGDSLFYYDGRHSWLFRPATKSWHQQTRGSGQQYTFPAITASAENVYLFGGLQSGTLSNEIQVFDFGARSWSILSAEFPKPLGRNGASISFDPVNSLVIAFGGLSTTQLINRIDVYNISSNSWNQAPASGDLPSARNRHCAAFHNGNLYVQGGLTGNGNAPAPGTLYSYSFSTGTWTAHNELNLPSRYDHSCVIIDDIFYVIGGFQSSNVRLDSVFAVNVTGNSQTRNANSLSMFQMNNLPNPLAQHGSAAAGSTIFTVGGSLSNGVYNQGVNFLVSDPSAAAKKSGGGGKLSTTAIALIVVGCVLGVAIIAFLLALFLVKRRRNIYADTEIALNSSHMTDLSALQSGNYKINYEELRLIMPPIGKGGFAVVNKAKYKGTTVAVKTFIHQDNFDVAFNDWIKEVSQLMRLRHPNIVLLIGCTLNPLSIVTEFVERGSVSDILRKDPSSLTVARKHVIISDVCRGMVYLHSQNPPIIHRDMKSANILIDRNWNAKIADFGISRPVASDQVMTKRVGTTRWMAPEVLRKEPYTELSDIYSFGIMMWELWADGQMPFDDIEFDSEIEQLVVSGTRPPIPAHTPDADRRAIEMSWQDVVSSRPSFEQLLEFFEREYNSGAKENEA